MSSLALSPLITASSQIKLVTTPHDLRLVVSGWRRYEDSVGLVVVEEPIHGNHLEQIRRSQDLTTRTIVTTLTTPTMEDQALLAGSGCDLIYAPEAAVLRPAGAAVEIRPGPLANIFEGQYQPELMREWPTLMVRLLLQAAPDYVFLGEQDYQRLRLMENLVRDLSLPAQIVGVPILRDTDGLALASGNNRLSPASRQQAAYLPEILFAAADQLKQGYPLASTLEDSHQKLTEAGFKIDYLELIDTRIFVPLSVLRRPARLIAAVWLDGIRLMDNVDVFGIA